jgi:hypothetical protein
VLALARCSVALAIGLVLALEQVQALVLGLVLALEEVEALALEQVQTLAVLLLALEHWLWNRFRH